MQFNSMRAVREAVMESDLGFFEKVFLRAATRIPSCQAKINDLIMPKLIGAGLVASDGEMMATEADAQARDWAAIIAMIIKWLPLILALFGL